MGTVTTGGSLSDRERSVQTAIASLMGEQWEARLHLARELADTKGREQEALSMLTRLNLLARPYALSGMTRGRGGRQSKPNSLISWSRSATRRMLRGP